MAMDDASEPNAAAEYLRNFSAPVTAKKLQAELCKRRGWSAERVSACIAEAMAAGAVFVWPRYRNAIRYWVRDPGTETRAAALGLASQLAMPRRSLVAGIAGNAHRCGKVAAEAAVKDLLNEGALRAARTMGPAPLLYATPSALVKGSMAILSERLRDLGIELPAEPAAQAQPVSEPEPAADRILAAVRRLQPGPAVPVTVQSLRAALPGLDKETFDRAVIELADRQQLYLTTHDHGWALPESERRQLVSDGAQKLYVAVTLRD